MKVNDFGPHYRWSKRMKKHIKKVLQQRASTARPDPEESAMKTVVVLPEVKAVLQKAQIGEHSVKLPPGRLDRKLYVAVNKVLVAAGGKWDGKFGVHYFPVDPRKALAEALETGVVGNRQQNLQAFFTPPDLAIEMAQLAEPEPYERVLEPSAGEGALALAVRALNPSAEITCIEIDRCHCKVLESHGFNTLAFDFMAVDPPSSPTRFDKVVMNPPFTAGQDVKHVTHAFKFLRRGGLLVALVSPAFRYRQTALHSEFRDLHSNYCVSEKDVPSGTFKNTDIATVLIAWRNPL
jgi:predicted RNA methylase